MTQLFDPRDYIATPSLMDRFGEPPFSVLDTRSGRWATRRAAWDSLDLSSRNGRSDALTFTRPDATDPVSQKLLAMSDGTSTFDPVLTELVIRWWSPMAGVVLDPFAGGSVRGVVSAALGRAYHGIDLSADQVGANRDTARRLEGEHPAIFDTSPTWYVGDAAEGMPNVTADLVLTCPPYGTLERYSDDPRDLSTMTAGRFIAPYFQAIDAAVARLRADRFAVFVVGNYREGGELIDLVGMTIDGFHAAGATYYAQAILINAVGTAGMRASATFPAGRKPITCHQHILVFVKGDGMAAARAAEPIPDYTSVSS